MTLIRNLFFTCLLFISFAASSLHAQEFFLGSAYAPVTIIEYGSYNCVHCARFINDIFPKLKKEYIDPGKVKFIFRDFPLNSNSIRASMMAHCYAQGDNQRFFIINKMLFQSYGLLNSANEVKAIEHLRSIAKIAKMSDFETCITDKQLFDEIMHQKLEFAKKDGIKAVPKILINKKIYPKASLDFKELKKVIDGILAEQA